MSLPKSNNFLPFESMNFRHIIFSYRHNKIKGIESFQFLVAMIFTHQKIPFLSKTKACFKFHYHIYSNVWISKSSISQMYITFSQKCISQKLLKIWTWRHHHYVKNGPYSNFASGGYLLPLNFLMVFHW